MTNPEEKFIDYCDQMLQNVSDELNVKQVIIPIAQSPTINVVFNWDTIKQESRGFIVELDGETKDAPKTLVIVLMNLFTGGVIEDMQKVRDIVSEGLKQRAEAKIKVRQPLQSVTIKI